MGIQINGNNDIISALDGSWTAEGASINTSGILTATTFKGNIVGTAATFTGPVTIGGTLTYEDVTNIDSVGLVTARGDIHVGENIAHIGDTDTKIVLTDNNIDLQTGGSSRLYASNFGVFVQTGLGLGFLASSGPSPSIKSGGTNNQDLLLTTGSGNPTRFHIHADGSITQNYGNPNASAVFRISKNGSGAAELRFDTATNNTASLYLGDDEQLRIRYGGTEVVRFASDGKVGINTSAPRSDLQITTAGSGYQHGTLRIGGSVADLGLVLDYDQSASTTARIYANDNYNSDSSVLKICSDLDDNPNQLVLMGSGKVGINTNSPGAKLTVWADDSDTDRDIFQVRGKTGAFNIRVNDADAANPEWAIRTYASEPIVFMQGTQEKARIDSGGKLLVGDGSAITQARAFEVRGTGNQGILVGSTNNSGAQLLLDGIGNGDGSGGDYGALEVPTSGHLTIRNHDADKDIIFGVGSAVGGNDSVVLRSNGNFGIGNRTGSPSSLLHVHTGSGDAVVTVEGAADAWLTLKSHGGDSQIRFGDASSGSAGQIRFDHGTDNLFFEKGGSQRGKIASDGSTTWGPSSAGTSNMQWNKDTNQIPHFFWGQGGGAQPSDGCVVIGSPQTDICSQRVGTILFGSTTSGGSGNTGLKAGINCVTNASPGSDFNAGGNLIFQSKPNNATIAERMRIESNGDVAINTTDGDFGQTNSASNFAKGDPKLGVHGSIAIMNTSSTTTEYSQLAFYRRTTSEPQGNGSHRITSTSNLGRISWNGASNDTSFPDEVCVIQAVANGGDWWSGSNRRASLQFHNNNVGEMGRFDSSGVFSGRPIMNRNTSGVSGGGWTTSGAWKVLVDLNVHPSNALYMCDAAMQNLSAYTATFWVYKSDNGHYCIVYEETSLCSFRLNGTQIEIRQNSGADQTTTSGYQKVFCALGMNTPKS